MKILFFSLFLLLSCIIARTQVIISTITVKGTVADSISGKPLAYVTVALLDVKTGIAVKNALTKGDGSFEITGPGNRYYQLALTFTGYEVKLIPSISERILINVGQVVLSPSGTRLKEVMVTGVRPVIKREIDGISYDVTADPESVALSALDIMRKVPLLTVDASDNIKLKGGSNYKILINGKESALITRNPSDVLKAMPATNIDKIEVITSPPAKYDAEGLAGIINIITKRNIGQGYNVGINGRYNTVWGPGLNINGTLKQGKFGLSAFAGHNVHDRQTTGFGNDQTFFGDKSVLSQAGTKMFKGRHDYASLDVSYEFDSLNLLTANMELYDGNNSRNSSQFSNIHDSDLAVQQQYRLINNGNNSSSGLDAGVDYQLGFKTDKKRLLTLSYKYNYSPEKQFNNNSFSEMINLQQTPYRQYNNAGNKEHTMQADYVHPFRKLTLEGGGKIILRNNFSNFQTSNYNDSIKEFVVNPSQSNDFNYHQDIYSIYNSYQVKWEKWSVKGGARVEHTTVNAEFVSSGNAIGRSYDNIIPSMSVQWDFKNSSINFGYTDRISRPGIFQLNPFVDKSNPGFNSTGNPNLRPQLNHSLEINYNNSDKNSIDIGLSYSFSKNSIQNVSSLQVDNTGDTVTLTTFQNLGSNEMLGLNFNTNFTINKDITFSLNGQAAHVWLKGTYNGAPYRNNGYTGNLFFNGGYKFGGTYRIGLDAGIYSGDVNLQGKSNSFIFTSYHFSRTFWDKKVTISLASNNPYNKYFTFRSHTKTPDFYQSSFYQNPYRTFAIRVNFKFGKLNSDIKKNQRGINNDDIKPVKTGTTN